MFYCVFIGLISPVSLAQCTTWLPTLAILKPQLWLVLELGQSLTKHWHPPKNKSCCWNLLTGSEQGWNHTSSKTMAATKIKDHMGEPLLHLVHLCEPASCELAEILTTPVEPLLLSTKSPLHLYCATLSLEYYVLNLTKIGQSSYSCKQMCKCENSSRLSFPPQKWQVAETKSATSKLAV